MAYTDIDKPSDYFETLLSTGDGGSQTFTGLDFQPDFVWSKRRETHVHQLYDSVRTAGSGKALQSDSDAAEGGDGGTYGYLSSFTSDGFASTAGSSNNNYFNASGGTYVFWNWKAGTSVSGNTGGSGTAKTYTGSVNTDAGFSIIRYIGNGTAGHTIPHHLGTTPTWFIARTISAAKEWDVYHHKLASSPESDYIVLNTTAAAAGATKWNDTAPTSSVVTLGDSSQINTNDGTCILYAFSEKQGYSKFGSYTGNGNADGTFVYTGFKPAWVMFKKSSATGNWFMMNNKMFPANGINASGGDQKYLFANTSNDEQGGYGQTDILSNGFKLRGSDGDLNGSGVTYIYMAFAENPFVTSTGVPATAR
jgi:hypothetical protein